MLYALVGYISLTLMMILILRGKLSPAFCFTIIPVIAAIICGFGFEEIISFIDKGMGTIWKTALLFVFSVSYFGIMNDVGLFDPMVKALVKMAGHNVVLVMVATSLIAVVGHMDGAAASTYLITIPVMLPIYKKLGISPLKLLLLVGLSTGIMNLVPWGGPTIRAATAIEMDPNQLWVSMIPMQIAGLVIAVVAAVLLGLQEKKRIEKEGLVLDGEDVQAAEENEEERLLKRPKLMPVNLVLTALVIFFLVKGGITPFIIFLFGTMIALAVNYPDMKQQVSLMQKYSNSYSNLVVTIVAAGIFLGVFANSGIITNMAQVLISLLPHGLLKYLHIIMGVLGAPMGMVMGPDPYYYAVMPLVIETVSQFGVLPEQVAHAMLIGENVALSVSPCVAVNFLALGLAGCELKDHIKANFKWEWLVSVLMLVIGIVIGIV